MKKKGENLQENNLREEEKKHDTLPGKVKGQVMLACATGAFAAFLYMLMFHWKVSEPTIYAGPGTLEKGTIATGGSSVRDAPWILSYTVKVPSKYQGYVALRTIYARKGACGKEGLNVGEAVLLTSYFRKDRNVARAAFTDEGCVLQDSTLLSEIQEARNRQSAIIVGVFMLVAAYLFFSAIVEWFRTRRMRLSVTKSMHD